HDAGSLHGGLLLHLFAEAIGVRPGGRDDAVGIATGLGQQLRRLVLHPLEFLACLAGVVECAGDRLPAQLESLEERPPGELRQKRREDEKGEDRPDEQAGIRLYEGIVHCSCYLSRTISRQNTSARIATPSSRKSGRFVAAVICAEAAGCRAMASAVAAARRPMP